MSNCELCGQPMPEGEEMFKYHGYSGACPKPPGPVALVNPLPEGALFSRGHLVELWRQHGGAIDKKGRAWIEADILAALLNSIIERAIPFALKERSPPAAAGVGNLTMEMIEAAEISMRTPFHSWNPDDAHAVSALICTARALLSTHQ